MTNPVLAATAVGLYEQPLTANVPLTVTVNGLDGTWGTPDDLYVLNHGTTFLFVRLGDTVTVGDQSAVIVPPAGHVTVRLHGTAGTADLSAVSAADGSVSVTRKYDTGPTTSLNVTDNGDGTATIA